MSQVALEGDGLDPGYGVGFGIDRTADVQAGKVVKSREAPP
jgi:hypothetical protein